MVRIKKTWAGRFIDGRKDLKILREQDYLQFLIVFSKDCKSVEPLPSNKKTSE